jgi:hypothetical protein
VLAAITLWLQQDYIGNRVYINHYYLELKFVCKDNYLSPLPAARSSLLMSKVATSLLTSST